MLKLDHINLYYGAVHALQDVSLEVREGEIVSLIGANGAGKTSILRAISGLNSIKSGSINYLGQEINRKMAHNIVKNGISHVPEGRRVFGDLTVIENIQMGAYLQKDKKKVSNKIEEILTDFPRLRERAKQQAVTLSGGEQQMLAVARALMSEPKLLLMDEPSMGLAPQIVEAIFQLIVSINAKGTTVLLVEQNANAALSIADYAYVLENGKIIMEGDAQEMLHNDDVQKAYLGG